MFLNSFRNKPNNINIIHKSLSTVLNQKWDLLTAVCVERKSVVTPLLNDIENDYQKYLSRVEHERSFKSDFELQHEADLKQAELLKAGSDVDVVAKQTAQDFIDASIEEFKKFKFADRITSADKNNDQKSLNRKLDKHLVLVTKEKLGDKNYYILPQISRNDGETLRQTADRLLKEYGGDDLKALIYGNAPTGFYKYKYPSKVQERNGAIGAKVFIYFARYQEGEVTKKEFDFKWLDREELRKELHPNYHRSIAQFLIDEE